MITANPITVGRIILLGLIESNTFSSEEVISLDVEVSGIKLSLKRRNNKRCIPVVRRVNIISALHLLVIKLP